MTKKKRYYECVNCGCELDELNDFIVHSKEHNVILCKDCYELPQWYELINV